MTMTGNGFSFGALLQTFRKRKHLTQQGLAESLGVHRRTLVRWEQGDYLPESKAMVLELARHLHLDDQETRQLIEASLTALAPHWSVPLPRNPFFTGREPILEALHAQLGIKQAVALTQPSALYGLGGVGKTQIALEYAYQHAMEYSAVFWIGAETVETILASYLTIAEVLQLPERHEADQQRMVTAVQRWLATHHGWLLIWDNLEDLDLLTHFLPVIHRGATFLITTRRQTLGTLASGLELLPMLLEEGMLFLLRRAKVIPLETTREHLPQVVQQRPGDYEAAQELWRIMGGLPLALDQAGAYIEETGCNPPGYLHRYEQYCASMLARRGSFSSAHPHSVLMTFRLLLERLEREQPAAADFLCFCCVLHADAIPEELFVEGAACLGPALAPVAADPLRFDQAIATLRNLSLIQSQPEMHTFSLHRLVQAVLKETLEPVAVHCWSERVLQALIVAFPEPDFPNWARCERLVLHVQMILPLAEQGSQSLPEARDLFCKAGSYVLERGRYAQAEPLLVVACALAEQEALRNDQHTAYTFDRLATLYWRQGKYQQAEPLFQRALALSEQNLGPIHLDTSIYLNDLALLYYEQGDYEQAEVLQYRALRIVEKQLEPLHLDLAQSLENMARIMQAQGKYAQAEAYYQHALTIWESQPGPAHPSMTFCLNNLGNLYVEQGKYDLAEPFIQRALVLRQQILGETHPRTAASLHNLARLSFKQGKQENAVQLVQHALRILEQPGGLERSLLALALETLGAIYLAQGKDEQVEPLLLRALSIQEHHLRPQHPDIARTLCDLALLRKVQGRLGEAISFAQRTLSICSQSLRETHPQTVAAQTLYTQLLQELAATKETASKQDMEAIAGTYSEEHQTDQIVFLLQKGDHPSSLANDLLQGFLNACCDLHPRAWCRSADLWQAYQQWTAEQHERYSLSRRAFIVQLKMHGCHTDRTKTARIWRGITLVSKHDDGG